MATDPLDPRLLRSQNRQQLLSDILRNAKGAPEAALTMGTSLADMAGTGLGTLAGMAKQKLSGENVDLGAATDTLQEGKFTYAPRTVGGQETLRGLATVTEPLEKGAQYAGQKTSDVTGSPAAGAAVYTALNMADPELLGPAAAKVAALRGAQRVARGATFDPVSNTGMGGKQRGAWSPGDIADTEGNFEMRSTVEDALGKLKPAEQKARGKQMLQVLKKYGAKEEDLKWSGLNDALANDIPVTADDIRAHMAESGVQVAPSRYGASAPDVAKGAEAELDEDAISEKAYDLAREDSDLSYPYSITRDGEEVGTADNYRDAQRMLEQEKESMIESETDHYLENISDFVDEETLSTMSDSDKQTWAEEQAQSSVEDSYTWEVEQDYEADPINLEDLRTYYEGEIRRNPGDYGLEGSMGAKPANWEQYVIDSPGGQQGSNYGETIMQLGREGRYGRGIDIDTENTPANYEQMTPLQRARFDALKKAKTEAPSIKAAQDWKYTTHFKDVNPLVYTRESDWPKPPGATTEGSMRMIEELQSDWGQIGRKKGIFDPEKSAAQAAKLRETMGPKIVALRDQAVDLLNRMPEAEQGTVASRLGLGDSSQLMQHVLDVADRASRDPGINFPAFIGSLGDHIYYGSNDTAIENAGRALNRAGEDLSSALEGTTKGLPPAPFIEDAKKFSQLALQQAIADAVRRGDQYVGVSPGYTHAPERWGSEDLSWWTDEQANPVNENQTEMFEGAAPPVPTKRRVAARSAQSETTRGEKWKETVRALRRNPDEEAPYYTTVEEIDTSSPEAAAQIEQIVRDKLSYEATQYADPEQFIKDRAAKILQNMQKQTEGDYSPRSHGMNEFYDKIVPGVLEKILKEAGSTGSGTGVVRGAEAPIGRPMAMVFDSTLNEWRPRELNSESEIAQYKGLAASQPDKYQFRPAQMHYVEIDPELARAAKRGFKLPF